MARLAIISACCVLAAGTAAQAQVTGVSGSSATTVSFTPTAGPSTFTNSGPGQAGAAGNGAAFYSSFATNPSTISFESANASSGTDISTTSTTTVDITIKNGGLASDLPTLQSTITPGSVGLYLADRTGACGGSGIFSPSADPFGGCGQVKIGSFQDLNKNVEGNVAGASFEFKVTVGGATVYDLTGMETLHRGDTDRPSLAISGLTEALTINGDSVDPTGVLQGLTETLRGPAGTADGFQWDPSAVNIALGTLAAGASEDVVYSSTVSTFSTEGCGSTDLSECLVPYASFGDPIGKSGGQSNAIRFGGQGFSPLLSLTTASDSIPFVDNWAPETFDLPTFNFNTGVLSFGVPEPETWMSMILGFGLLGAALRRRRVLGYT